MSGSFCLGNCGSKLRFQRTEKKSKFIINELYYILHPLTLRQIGEILGSI